MLNVDVETGLGSDVGSYCSDSLGGAFKGPFCLFCAHGILPLGSRWPPPPSPPNINHISSVNDKDIVYT